MGDTIFAAGAAGVPFTSSSSSSSAAAAVADATSPAAAAAALKRTCDPCAASKVKCSGTQPCKRCTSRGLDCFYRARKKRTGKSNEDDDSSGGGGAYTKKVKAPGIGEAEEALLADKAVDQAVDNLKWQTAKLQAHERRSWTVFFTLFKNYSAGCGRFWFERQLARLQLRLEKANRRDLLGTLRAWAASLDVDWQKVQDRFVICVQALADPDSRASHLYNCGCLHLHVGGKVAPGAHYQERFLGPDEARRAPVENLLGADAETARITMTTSGKFPEDIAFVSVNTKFEQLFGLTQRMVSDLTQVMGSGLLPWGGDLLCLIIENEADIFAFMQICAINLNWKFLCSQAQFPVVREVPSVHVFPVRTAHSSHNIPCLVKCVHRELIDLNRGITLEVTMAFEPMVALPSLSSSSSTAPTTPQQFEMELPLEDGEYGRGAEAAGTTVGTALANGQDELAPTVDEVFFPDIDLQASDDIFVRDLLNFARLTGDMN